MAAWTSGLRIEHYGGTSPDGSSSDSPVVSRGQSVTNLDRNDLGVDEGVRQMSGLFGHYSDTTGHAIQCNTGQTREKKPA